MSDERAFELVRLFLAHARVHHSFGATEMEPPLEAIARVAELARGVALVGYEPHNGFHFSDLRDAYVTGAKSGKAHPEIADALIEAAGEAYAKTKAVSAGGAPEQPYTASRDYSAVISTQVHGAPEQMPVAFMLRWPNGEAHTAYVIEGNALEHRDALNGDGFVGPRKFSVVPLYFAALPSRSAPPQESSIERFHTLCEELGREAMHDERWKSATPPINYWLAGILYATTQLISRSAPTTEEQT